MFRALALAITLCWLFTTAAAACGMPPVHEAMSTANATPIGTPGATDPAACTVAPRSLTELRQLLVEAGRAGATPIAEPEAITLAELPAGEPADIETIAAITAAAEQFMACLNAGDVLRILALLSDDAVRLFVTDFEGILEESTDLGTPQPLPEDEWVRLGEVTAARVLLDGRVGAVIRPAAPSAGEPVFLILVQEGNRWLIDSLVDVEEPAEDDDCCPATSEPDEVGMIGGFLD